MCAVRTGHLLLMVETPHTQNQKTGKTPGQQNPKTTKQKPKPKHRQTRENSGVSSLYIIGETWRKGELRLFATWATNSISSCCRFACEEALCKRPVSGQAKSQALAGASAQAI